MMNVEPLSWPAGRKRLIAAILVMFMPQAAIAEEIPSGLRGNWSENCDDPSAARIVLGTASVSIVVDGRRHDYAGVSVSRTWVGGAKASGDQIWLPTSRAPGGPFAFVIAVTPGKKGVLVLEEGHPDHGRDIRQLFGSGFRHCRGGSAADAGGAPSPGDGNGNLDVAVTERGGDGQMANCASSVVAGLKAGGEGHGLWTCSVSTTDKTRRASALPGK